MAAIARRSIRARITVAELAAADDLDGVQDATKTIDVSGAQRVLICSMIGSAGTVGIDAVVISHDGGDSWVADASLLPVSADDGTGTIAVGGVMEAAGVEAITFAAAVFKSGPHNGPTLLRVTRDTTDGLGGADWVGGAPSVNAIIIR